MMGQLITKVKNIRLNMLLLLANSIVARTPSHTLRDAFYRFVMAIKIGLNSSIHMGLLLYTRGQIHIADHTVIDRDCTLDGRGGITIGSNVNLAPEVMILTASHEPDSPFFAGYERPVIIEDYVWVATRAVILPGVTLGRACVVAAGAVVAKSVPANAIVAGNPARVIRYRCGPQLYELDYQRVLH